VLNEIFLIRAPGAARHHTFQDRWSCSWSVSSGRIPAGNSPSISSCNAYIYCTLCSERHVTTAWLFWVL